MKPITRTTKVWLLLALMALAGAALLAAAGGPLAVESEETAERPSREAAVEHNNLGIAFLAQFKKAEAEQEIRKALEADPDYLPALVNLAIAQLAQVRYDEAIENFRRALLVDPDNTHAHYNLSLILKIQGKAAAGLKHGMLALRGDPRDADIQYNVASLHQANREFDKAIEGYEAALRLDPNLLPALYGLGRAYIGKGDMENGKKYISQHQALQAASNLPASSAGLSYGEQGKYSLAMDDPSIRSAKAPPLPPGQVTFTDITSGSGLLFSHEGTGSARLLRAPLEVKGEIGALIRDRVAPLLGSGVTLADIDGDEAEEIILLNTNGGKASIFLNKGKMVFEAAPSLAKVIPGGAGMGAVAGDVDNDKDLDLLVTRYGGVTLLLNDGSGSFSPAELPPFPENQLAAGASFADVDHDSDLDLFISSLLAPPNPPGDPVEFPAGFGGGGLHLFRNNGNGSFTDITAEARFNDGPYRNVGAAFSDFDNDRDIDLAVSRMGGGIALFTNNRDGTFSNIAADAGLPTQGDFLGICAGDYNRDGYMDLVATSWSHSLPRLFRNDGSGRFALDVGALAKIPRGESGPLFGCGFADVDNDGLTDILAVNGTDKGGAVRLLRNLGGDEFEDGDGLTGLASIPARHGRGLAVGDLDGDGDFDLIVSNNGGRPTLLRNDGGNRNHWIAVRTNGFNSNYTGVGTKVEVKAGLLWQKTEVAAGSGYLSSHSLRPLFGLANYTRVDALRLLWPGGVLQDEMRLEPDKMHAIAELDRKGTSCPILYAWNGSEVAFVTDFLGGSAFGYLTAPGQYNYPDTDEYIRMPPDRIRERDGRYEIFMVNQLEETIYFDEADLLLVDHPAGTEVFPDERLMPGPPYPEYRLHTVHRMRPPAAARDGRGNDVLDLLSEWDGRYVGGFALLPFKGYAERHSLTLDLGAYPEKGAVLLLAGWIDYADSTSNLAASQAGVKLVTPYLEALDPSTGRWVMALPRMGFPAGLPKTMTVELTGHLPEGARRIRITTSQRIYWDQILIAEPAGATPRVTRLDPLGAVLRYRGFPLTNRPSGTRGLFSYDYAREQPFVIWKAHAGAYTRFGDVRDLLLETDDRYVITRGGDEIKVAFDARALPPPVPGWSRTIILYTDGFGKDMDVNSARPHRVGPLPYHAMPRFPYPESAAYPTQEHLDYLALYNTRRVRESIPPLSP